MNRILYVEDDPINALVVKKLLGNVFYISHVFDGETCIQVIASERFDAVLMDINLGKGKMDGVQTLHQLRSVAGFATIPVIAVTSYALPEDRERFLQEGFDAYMAKPIDRKQMIEMLNRFLHR
jgi:CheY-like chemotaxis protein